MTDLITEARELCESATTGNSFSQKFAEIKRIINDVRTESEKLARTKQCYTCALGNQDEAGTYCENAADDYDCEDEGCSNFVDGSVSYAKIAEDDLHTVLEALPELVDALEKAEEQNKQLMHEVCKLACESVERDRALAKLEAEVMTILGDKE